MFKGCVCSQDDETDFIYRLDDEEGKRDRHEIKQGFEPGPTKFWSDPLSN